MKLSPDSPELTAYVLDALTPEERASVEASLATSPELASEVADLRKTADQVAQLLASEPATELSPAQRKRILIRSASGSAAESPQIPSPQRSNLQRTPSLWQMLRASWAWGATAVAALALTVVLLQQGRSTDRDFETLRYQEGPQKRAEKPPVSTTTALSSKSDPALKRLAAPEPLAETSVKLGQTLDSATASSPGPVTRVPQPANLPQRGLEVSPAPAPPEPALARRYGLAPRETERFVRQDTLSPATSLNLQRKELADSGAETVLREQIHERSVELAYRGLRATDFDFHAVNGTKLQVMETPGTESYSGTPENTFKSPTVAPLSTFSLDVDTASYANVRRFLREGSLPPPDAVRIEELINYFRYDYPAPRGGEPFGSTVEIAESPWHEGNKLVRIGLQAKSVDRGERPRANLVFLLDVSGSMAPENKLPLVKRSLRLLLDRLGEKDTVSIVTYAGDSRIALEPTPVSDSGRQRIASVIEGLRAGSGTAGAAGIQNAYGLATNHFVAGGVNRVILCTDGDFNIGITDPSELHRLIEEKATSGVFLSVLGYGMGNLKDSTMELLADKGNGNYAYVDSYSEARKVLGEQLDATLVTIAKDVKVQVEFNPARVRSYRLVGYENRVLRDREFNDDTKDAGEVGAGHQVTVLYEIEPAVPHLTGTDPLRYQPARPSDAPAPALKPGHEEELFHLKIRYKAPDGTRSRLIETPVRDTTGDLTRATPDFKFAAAVAGYGMLLRNSELKGTLGWDAVLRLAEQGVGTDKEGYRSEFVDLARKAQQLSTRK